MKLSATNFQKPLLKVLLDLSDGVDGIAIKGTETYAPVMAIMGITDINAHGMNDSSGQPMVAKWIQWANSNLKKANLTTNAGRGEWALTPKGVKKALKYSQKAAGASTVTDPSTAPTVMDLAPVSPQVAPVLGYHTDPYIVSLGIAQTSCFGSYTDHKTASCSNCPLATECRNMMYTDFTQLAAAMSMPAPVVPAPTPVASTPAAPAAPATKPGGKDFSNFDFSAADIIVSRSTTVCERCGEPIGVADRCRWVGSIDGYNDGGLFHIECSGGE